MLKSRRNFLTNLTITIIGGKALTIFPSPTSAKNFSKGIEIKKGYIVFNEDTQKVMEALAEAIVPGSKEINMKAKVMDYVNKDRVAATFFDAGLWHVNSLSRSKYKKPFYELKDKEKINKLLTHVKTSNNIFFNQFRYLIVRMYYSDDQVWKKLSYSGPPQPKGFMDYSEPPIQAE